MTADALDRMVAEDAARLVAGRAQHRSAGDVALSVAAWLSVAAFGVVAGLVAFLAVTA